MFVSLRLAALTSTLFISHVFGRAIPLVSFQLMLWFVEFDCSELNFVMVMQDIVIVRTETSPLSALMTKTFAARMNPRIRILFVGEYISHNKNYLQSQGLKRWM